MLNFLFGNGIDMALVTLPIVSLSTIYNMKIRVFRGRGIKVILKGTIRARERDERL